MKIYMVIADYGTNDEAWEELVGAWTDEGIANYEKELYINKLEQLKATLKPIYDEIVLYYSYNEQEDEEIEDYLDYDQESMDIYQKYIDLDNFNFCMIRSIEIDKRLIDLLPTT